MDKNSPVIFRRKIYDDLVNWKERDSKKYALMIEGVRRVGKSTIVEEFAKNEYRTFMIIDFLNAEKRIKDAFINYSHDMGQLTRILSGYYGIRLYENESLIVLDEVQEFPRAHQLVKYLVKYGKYAIIETGSLITLKMKMKMTLPSEVIPISMNPMDFEEFAWATGHKVQLELAKQSFEKRVPVDKGIHEILTDLYRTYMITGGMPQAVSALIETNSFIDVETAKRSILELYRNDIWRESDGILMEVFESIPSMLNRVNRKFSPGRVKKKTRSNRYESRISWLKASKIVNICYNCVNPDPAISQFQDVNDLKMYFVDTGLLLTMALQSNIVGRDELYGKLLSGRMSMNKGMFFENMVAQSLVASGHDLHFCQFDFDDEETGKKKKYELDFLMAKGRKLVAMEVKSGRPGSHRSLTHFRKKYGKVIESSYIICNSNLMVADDIVYIPIYMAMYL